MNEKNCFDILHIPRDASLDDAKDSYKRLVKVWHPDQYGNFPEKRVIAEEKLKEINIAYRDIVAILKRNPVVNETPFEGEKKKPTPDRKPRASNRKGKAFWNHVSLFFSSHFFKSGQARNKQQDDDSHAGSDKREDGSSVGTENGTASDFQQILRRAICDKRPSSGVYKQRNGERIHVQRKSGSISSHRFHINKKRNRGDRIEKISPVSRVSRIGGN